jgi:NhaP-type Na+/H+ or K+/H+ antiporter/carbonic anhydrase
MRVLSTSSSTTSVSNISLILTVLRVLPLLLLLPFGESQSIYSTRSGGGSSSNADEVESHDDILFAYFETPLENDVGHIGPTHWLDLDIANNQCGKGGQKNGFGQSPVVFPYRLTNYEECTSNLDGYETFDGNCSWADVEYPISKGILALKPKKDPNGIPYCSLGKWKIPQSDALYEVTEVHLKHGAEHALEGYQEMVELQVFHEDEKHETRAAFSIRMNPNFSQDAISNDVIDNMLNGWRTTYWKTHDYCSTHENGSGIFNVNTVLEAHQKLIVCQELDNRPDAETYIRDTVPPSSSLLIPNFVSVGSIIPKDFNILTYEGSLTTPPCTENVYWNVVRESQDIITYQEYVEIMNIVNCVKEESTCELGSVASEFGLTKRPPQMLDGRKIAHRCVDGPSTKYEKAEVPETEVYEKEEENEPVWALLFPFTITFIGLIVFYISGRFIPLVPYTAILFLVGTIMGVIMVSDPNNQLERSIYMWDDIDGELLLIAFLPGLLFKDAYCLDVHLFEKAFVQILIMAFPMVLAGTTLMAVFAFYILPYDWTFNFCMTFGAILSATDPVAVSALLQELGAPPRLKTHISGESLMNDGSAIVFFTIFYKLFLEEQNLPGGEVIGLGSGVYMFIKMSIFAALLGIAFGIGLIGILYMLNRRFNTEEKIVQVTATFCIAYVSYYIAEAVFHLSGVITVVFCGLITKYFASSLIIDHDMMDKFWALTEHLLNTGKRVLRYYIFVHD